MCIKGGSVAQWLACWTRDPAVAGSIPTTAHVDLDLDLDIVLLLGLVDHSPFRSLVSNLDIDSIVKI